MLLLTIALHAASEKSAVSNIAPDMVFNILVVIDNPFLLLLKGYEIEWYLSFKALIVILQIT